MSPSEIGCCLSHLKVWNKINEDKSEIEEELGDILFTVANLCRKEGLSPEIALNQSSDKFTRRANLFVELKSKFEHLSDEELWSKAKLISKKTSK